MINKKDKIFRKKPEESFDEYCHRISLLRNTYDDMTWTDVATIINHETGFEYSCDKYRKTERKYLEEHGVIPEESSVDTENAADSDNTACVDGICEFSSMFNKETITTNYEKNETTSSKEIPLTEEQLKDSNELLKAHGFEPEKWIIKSATNSKTTRMTVDGKTFVYCSRITVKPKESPVSNIKEIAKYLETFKAPKLPVHKTIKPTDEYLLVPLYDLHFGRLPDEEFDHYDINEEKERIINHVKKYIDKFYGRTFKNVYLVIGQDFLNSSFTGFTSSQSHLQSNAIDFRTMFKAGAELLISIINMFADTCNHLDVIGSLGNHDISEEAMMFMLLSAYYRHEHNISVDDGRAPRKYLEIGNSCVGLGHLDKEHKRAYGLMQIEAKDIWSRTKTHVFIAGHLHHFNVTNENGIEIYRVPSICPPDRWTNEQGYVMNEPKTMCFIFDEEEGLAETHFMYL